jgi:hypothetical protein
MISDILNLFMYFFQGFCLQFLFNNFLKIKYKRAVKINLSVYLIGAAWFLIRIIYDFAFSISSQNDKLVLRILICFFVTFLFSLFIYQGNVLLKLFLTLVFITVCDLSFFIAHSILTFIGDIYSKIIVEVLKNSQSSSIHKYVQILGIGLYAIHTLMIIIFCFVLYLSINSIVNNYSYKEYKLKDKEFLFLISPSMAGLLISIFLRIVLVTIKDRKIISLYDNHPVLIFIVPAISIVSLISIVGGIRLFQDMISLNEEKRNRVIVESQITGMQRHIKEIESLYDGIRGIKHDINNSILVIKELMIKEGFNLEDDSLEINQYLAGIDKTIKQLDFKFSTGNPVTDVVINSKYNEAKKKLSDFSMDAYNFIFPKDLKISVFDIGIILNNGLDNAIEACEMLIKKQPDTESYINICSWKEGKMFFIEIVNSFDGQICFNAADGLPLTNKKDKELHGIGLKNIRNSARKYYGDIDCTTAGQKFRLTIMLKDSEIISTERGLG